MESLNDFRWVGCENSLDRYGWSVPCFYEDIAECYIKLKKPMDAFKHFERALEAWLTTLDLGPLYERAENTGIVSGAHKCMKAFQEALLLPPPASEGAEASALRGYYEGRAKELEKKLPERLQTFQRKI